VQNPVEKRAPYSSRNPMLLTLTQQNPWWKTRTVQQPQPNAANPNTAESMVVNAHRTRSSTSLVQIDGGNHVLCNVWALVADETPFTTSVLKAWYNALSPVMMHRFSKGAYVDVCVIKAGDRMHG
jgi:hypothetical protein